MYVDRRHLQWSVFIVEKTYLLLLSTHIPKYCFKGSKFAKQIWASGVAQLVVLDWGSKGCLSMTRCWWSQCVVSLSKTLYPQAAWYWFNPGRQEIVMT